MECINPEEPRDYFWDDEESEDQLMKEIWEFNTQRPDMNLEDNADQIINQDEILQNQTIWNQQVNITHHDINLSQ